MIQYSHVSPMYCPSGEYATDVTKEVSPVNGSAMT
jgi:hypothetical protein